jgi:hypothetical protein
VTVAFNATHYGLMPIGEAATCFTSSGGCPYDSLNISAEGTGGATGAVLDPDGIFVNYTLANTACSPSTVVTGILADDTAPGCWTNNHPQIQVEAKH